ncbi:predicted protein [Naegleria gruberi]|uniref:Poly [ADP-ribose] polymerase n=1 Tax=Naegleria gruberi TaxID=5762 RepID=D2VN22_NAEGR|nr:uncharacterized protein NAEGRDRAFT_80603 [Naegleria gruberi]EFC41845.1 predicted protein [Naegleria gruberi]|eukprot:XP_002674589.1 predicted protein [Naegleria gruberi strain NEG-M]
MQEIMNASCNSATLGSGRDQVSRIMYSKLIVSSVSRIENSTLFTSFKSRMNQLISYQDSINSLQVQTENISKTSKTFEWMKTIGLNSNMNEKYLWHGTKPEFVNTIAEHGFDERVANLNGLFGAGIYFAEYCSKSDQYCTPDHSNEFTLLLCRVVMGRQIHFTKQVMNNQRRPPEISGSNNRVYDSVIGQSNTSTNSYREFIVYDKCQCYPEFIIKYKRQ